MKQGKGHLWQRTAVALFLSIATGTAGGVAHGGQDGGAADGGGEARFLTGLDISYWADGRATVFGPGLTWGLVLEPERLDLLVAFGAMMGEGTYTVPVELRFDIHRELASWIQIYLAPGPVLLFDRFDGTWHHDLAVSASAGLLLSPAGYGWALRLGGDYNLRLWREIRNGVGFTVGFVYGF